MCRISGWIMDEGQWTSSEHSSRAELEGSIQMLVEDCAADMHVLECAAARCIRVRCSLESRSCERLAW